MVNWALQGDVSEVTRADLHATLAGETPTLLVHDAHTGVVDRVKVRLESDLIIDQRAVDLGHRHSTSLFGGEDAQLQGCNPVLIHTG